MSESNLTRISGQYRDPLVVSNIYKGDDDYNVSHENALSDGDEPGKGLLNNSVGGLTDIKTRSTLVVKNKYKNGFEYDSSNM